MHEPSSKLSEAIVVFKDEMDTKSIEDEVTVEDTYTFEGAKEGKEDTKGPLQLQPQQPSQSLPEH